VARFKYPPHWVTTAELFQAMLPLDAVTGRFCDGVRGGTFGSDAESKDAKDLSRRWCRGVERPTAGVE
jgi:hypothetical protein